jgi:hypothetical protein
MNLPHRPPAAPSFRVSFVRPYEESVRLRVAAAITRAGGDVGEVFREPLDLSAIERYLRGRGYSDEFVIPYHATGTVTGVDLVERFHALARPRRVLMPVKIASATLVESALRERVGDEGLGRVLIVSVSDLDARVPAMRAHFALSASS